MLDSKRGVGVAISSIWNRSNIMSADSLYDNIRSYLRLNSRVTQKVGGQINVGERFTMRFTASNAAYSAGLVNDPSVVFKNAKVFVEGTDYATPVTGSGWHEMPDTQLYPGEASSVDVEFTAERNLGGFGDLFNKELVAKAWIMGDLDQDKFFQIWNYQNVREEIHPT